METVRMRTAAFGGYNKSDVMEYIDALSRKAKSVEAELSGKISDLTSSRQALSAKVDEFSDRISQLEEAYQKSLRDTEKLRAEREAAAAEASSLRQKTVLLEVENNKLKSQISAADDSAKQLSAEKSKIADAIIDARENAQMMMNSARDEAVKKVRDAEEEINTLHHKVEDFISNVDDMKHTMATMLRNMESNVESISLQLEELHKEVYKIDNSLKVISLDAGVSKLKIRQSSEESLSADEIFGDDSDFTALG